MKTKKIIFIVLGILLVGCSVDDPDESLIQEKENITTTKTVEDKELNSSRESQIIEISIDFPEDQDDQNTCSGSENVISIVWNESSSLADREETRIFFEDNYGKEPNSQTSVDSMGIERETWIFNHNTNIAQLLPPHPDDLRTNCQRAADVVKSAIDAREGVETDDEQGGDILPDEDDDDDDDDDDD